MLSVLMFLRDSQVKEGVWDIQDLLRYDSPLMFLGINPSLAAKGSKRGHFFGGRGIQFWHCFNKARR